MAPRCMHDLWDFTDSSKALVIQATHGSVAQRGRRETSGPTHVSQRAVMHVTRFGAEANLGWCLEHPGGWS